MNMNKIKQFFKKVFYPNKIGKSLFFLNLSMFLLIGSLFLVVSIINSDLNKKYSYIPDNLLVIEDTNDYKADDLSSIKENAIKKGEVLGSILNNEAVVDYSIMSSISCSGESSIKKEYQIVFTTDKKLACINTLDCGFKLVETFNNDGIYVSQITANKLFSSGNITSIQMYTGNNLDDYIEVKIAGIYELYLPNCILDADLKNAYESERIFADFTIYNELESYYSFLNRSYVPTYSLSFKNDLNAKSIKLLNDNKITDYYTRTTEINNLIGPFKEIFNVLDLYLIVGGMAILISILFLIFQKEKKRKPSLYVEKVYYQKQTKLILTEALNNVFISSLSFIVSLVIFLIINLILLGVYNYSCFFNDSFYLFFILSIIVIFIGSLIFSFKTIKK